MLPPTVGSIPRISERLMAIHLTKPINIWTRASGGYVSLSFVRQQSPSSLQTTAADAPAVKATVPRTAKAAVLK